MKISNNKKNSKSFVNMFLILFLFFALILASLQVFAESAYCDDVCDGFCKNSHCCGDGVCSPIEKSYCEDDCPTLSVSTTISKSSFPRSETGVSINAYLNDPEQIIKTIKIFVGADSRISCPYTQNPCEYRFDGFDYSAGTYKFHAEVFNALGERKTSSAEGSFTVTPSTGLFDINIRPSRMPKADENVELSAVLRREPPRDADNVKIFIDSDSNEKKKCGISGSCIITFKATDSGYNYRTGETHEFYAKLFAADGRDLGNSDKISFTFSAGTQQSAGGLTPSSPTLSVPIGGSQEVTFTGGTALYSIKTCDTAKLDCTVSDANAGKFRITGKAQGTTTFVAKDNSGKEGSIDVTIGGCGSPGWKTSPYWGGCSECEQNDGGCGGRGCGTPEEYCDGTNWNTDFMPFIKQSEKSSKTAGHACPCKASGTLCDQISTCINFVPLTNGNSASDFKDDQSRAWRIARCLQPGGHDALVDFKNKYEVAWPDTKLDFYSETTEDKVKFPSGWFDLSHDGGCNGREWQWLPVYDLCAKQSDCLSGSTCNGKRCSCTNNNNCKSGLVCKDGVCGDFGNANCGNGILDTDEECDWKIPMKFKNGATCQSLGFASGNIECHSSGDDECTYDTSGCTGTTTGSGNCNDPLGSTPSISQVNPPSAKKNEQIKIIGNDVTNTAKFYWGAFEQVIVGNVNQGCTETTISVPSNLNSGKYTLKVYKARGKISNGLDFTIQSSSTILKYTPDGDATGYCDEDPQCLLNISVGGNGQCINSGQYSNDDYCENGLWSTRTKLLALKLLKMKSRDYTLFCDNKDNTLNYLLYQSASGIASNVLTSIQSNNFCVLKTPDNILVAASINKNAEDIANNINIFGTASCASALIDDGQYHSCASPNVWYNKRLKSFIFSTAPMQVPQDQESFSTISGIITNIITKIQQLISPPIDTTYVKQNKFNKLYLAQQSGRTITASMEGKYPRNMVIGYMGFDTDICNSIEQYNTIGNYILSGISCKKESNNYYVLAQGSQLTSLNPDSVWADLTSKLRLK